MLEKYEADWSDWGIDHPEEGPSCSCGFNGTPEECLQVREQAKADFYGYSEHLSDPSFGALGSIPAVRAERMRGVRQD